MSTAQKQLESIKISVMRAPWQYAPSAGGIIVSTDVVAKAASGAGVYNYVTGVQLINTSAVATEFVIKNGATIMWRTSLPANMVDTVSVVFPAPLRSSHNAVINIACITTGTATYANIQGYSGT